MLFVKLRESYPCAEPFLWDPEHMGKCESHVPSGGILYCNSTLNTAPENLGTQSTRI